MRKEMIQVQMLPQGSSTILICEGEKKVKNQTRNKPYQGDSIATMIVVSSYKIVRGK
jgi:hypothetical protein